MMEPRMGMRAVSWSPSAENCACARGRTPRATSVKVSARMMASSKVETGKLYSQACIVVFLELARTPFAARA